MIGRTSHDLLPREIADSIWARDQRTLETGKPESVEETWDLDHDTRTILVARNPIRNAEGEVVGVLSHYTNLSHIKQAFLLFEQNQKRFAALADTCPVGIFECNPQHQLTYVNPEWVRITGLSSAEAIGRDWIEFVDAQDYNNVKYLKGSEDSQPGGDRVDCTINGQQKVTVELSLNRVGDAQNYTVSYIGSIVDLTYRLAAQKELREKANLLRDLTSSVPAIIWQLSLNGECVFVNDFFETITGMSIETVLGKSWEKMIHPDDLATAVASLEKVYSGEKKHRPTRVQDEGERGRVALDAHPLPTHSLNGRKLCRSCRPHN